MSVSTIERREGGRAHDQTIGKSHSTGEQAETWGACSKQANVHLPDPFQRRKVCVNIHTLKVAKRVFPDELQAFKGPVHFELSSEASKRPFGPRCLAARRVRGEIATMPQPDQVWPFASFQDQVVTKAIKAALEKAGSGGAVSGKIPVKWPA